MHCFGKLSLWASSVIISTKFTTLDCDNWDFLCLGSRIQPQTDFGFIVLDIHGLIPEDTGEYECIATNSKGSASTKGKIVCKSRKVLQQPAFTNQLQQELPSVSEGDTVHLECRATPINDPHMKIEWFHDGQPLITGHRFKTVHDFGYIALDILYAYPEDSGTYTCKATNELGSATTECKIQATSKHYVFLWFERGFNDN